MVAIKAYYDGRAFVPERPLPASVEVNQEAIITLQDWNLKERLKLEKEKKERLVNLLGSISYDDYLAMEEALKDTEKVYSRDW
jgi:ethanolamine utilization microcompartment shell protein EutL